MTRKDTAKTPAEWLRLVALRTTELDSFDRRHDGTWFTSKNHERRTLVDALEDARLGEARARYKIPPPPAMPPVQPMTKFARTTLATLPTVLADLKDTHVRRTKTAVATGLGVDRDTLRAWITKGWLPWPPSD